MKICFINNFYPPQIKGGAEKVIARMVAAVKAEYQVCVITLANPGQPDSVATEDGVVVYRLQPRNWYHLWDAAKMPAWKKFFWHLKNIHNRQVVKRIMEIVAQERIQLVFTANLTGLSLSLPKFLHENGYPVMHNLFDYQLIDPFGTLFRRGHYILNLPWYLMIYKNWVKKYFDTLDCCIGPSWFIIKKHQEYGFFKNNRIEHLTTPVVPQLISAKAITEPKKPLPLIYVGQIEPTKGVDFLLKSLVDYHYSDWRLTVVGEGSSLESLRQRYETDSRIKFIGKKSGLELLELWQTHQLTIIPSLWWENFTTVAIESYQLGLPVLGSSSGGTPELIAVEQSGLVFDVGNEDDFHKKLDRIFEDPEVLVRWSAYLPDHLKQYNEESFQQEFGRIVNQLIRR